MIGLAGFLLLIAINTQTGWLYLVISFLVAVLALGLVGPRWVVRGLESSFEASTALAVEGDRIHLRTRLSNTSSFPKPALLLSLPATLGAQPAGTAAASPGAEGARSRAGEGDDGQQRWLIGEVAPHGSVCVDAAIEAPRRGVYRVGPVRVSTASPFGLFERTRELEASLDCTIWPRPFPLDGALATTGRGGTGYSARRGRSRGEGEHLRRIREYQQGDDTRHVHWALSARTGRLLVRELEASDQRDMVIVVDTGVPLRPPQPGASALDWLTRIAAAWVEDAARTQASLHLIAPGSELKVAGRSGVSLAMGWLAGLEEQASSRTWLDALRERASHHHRRCEILIACASSLLDLELLGSLAAARHRLFCVGLCVEPASGHEVEEPAGLSWDGWRAAIEGCGGRAVTVSRAALEAEAGRAVRAGAP